MQLHQLDARIERMLAELTQLTVRRRVPVEDIRIAPKGSEKTEPFLNGGTFGQLGEWWDFYFTLSVPEAFTGRVILRAKTGREQEWEATNPQFIARVNGRIMQALDTKHTEIVLQEKAKPFSSFGFILNAYTPPLKPQQQPPILSLMLEDVDVALLSLVYDLRVPYLAVLTLPAGDRERETTLETLSRALDLLDLREPYSDAFDASVLESRAYLQAEYYRPRASLPPVAIAECVGHTHIDVAWLWDIAQTRHKAVRSFSTVLNLMERYPEYRFMSSQAALYNMVKQDEPTVYEGIREAVKADRWEVEGGMWVEADCNLASGESLVRQFLHGQMFFQKEFQKRSRILWLPDVFGYSAALPQIMKLSGIDYFMTTKLSWSEFNLFPYDTFTWKGIDGSEVLTHFSPARDYAEGGASGNRDLPYYTTYNAHIVPKQLAGGWQRFQQKGLDDHFLFCYGYGDGGGGPTDWMLENARRLQTSMPATPIARQTHARPFFEALEARVKDDPRLPKWSGELYLEYHRGTYTAMAQNKRNNRKIEFLLREVELWSAYAARALGLPYPADMLHAIWEDVLTLQFHDILPGSSIKKVYDDSDMLYEKHFQALITLQKTALDAFSAGLSGDVLAFNSLSHERDDILWFDAPQDITALQDRAGNLFPVQHAQGRACAFVRGLSPMTATPLWFAREPMPTHVVSVSEKGFDTPFFSGIFDHAMRITSLIEKETGRQVAAPGKALNRIVCYENKPHNYDAWDVNIYYNRRHFEVDQVESVEVVASGPVLSILRVTYRYMRSTLIQNITFYHNLGRIDFDTTVDFHEVQYLLKAHFPVDVFYSEATFDIQYGNLRRPTHQNTSWDIARFEVCGHKWADVSEEGFGVSLLNDCKYGYSVDEHSLALTLLKSSTHPNPEADQGTHRFTYSLMPHTGGWREADTAAQAYQLNVPVSTLPGCGSGGEMPPLAACPSPNVIIEAVKAAEDGNGIILRLYEYHGRRTNTVLQLAFIPKHAIVCNLLEETIEAADLSGATISFALRPYEIKTFRVR